MSSIKLSKFTGINNVSHALDQSASDLSHAVNIDVTNAKRLRRRQGFVLLDDCRCYSNVFEASRFALATTSAGCMVAFDHTGVQRELHPSLTGRVWFAELADGRVAFSNGLQSGITDGYVVTSWGVLTPEHCGTSYQIPGKLPAGKYRYALSFVRSDGLESGLATSDVIELQRKAGLVVAGLPDSDGLRCRVYLTHTNGEVFYFAGEAQDGELRIAEHAATSHARTLDLSAPPAGRLLATWNGRALIAIGDLLLASQPTLPEQFDLTRDFKRFESEITLVQPVSGGIFVGTENALHFLEGNGFDSLVLRTVMHGRVVLGSGVTVDGYHIRVGDGNASGECMLCIAAGHIVAGLGGGQLVHIADKRYTTDCKEVSAAFRLVADMPQYLAQVLA